LNKIERGRAGIIMPLKNAFDFTEMPGGFRDASEVVEKVKSDSKSKQSMKQSVKKITDGLKKRNRISFANKRMATVKIDQ